MREVMSVAAIRRFLSDEDGSPAIEYALIACGISVAVVGVVTNLGSEVRTVLYDKLAALF